MTTAAAEPGHTNGSAAVSMGLRRYAELLSHPRRERRRALGPDVDEDYCFTDFLFSVSTGDHRRLTKVYEAERTKAPLGQASGPSGGYLVPADLQLELMGDVAEDALFRPRATVVNMTSSTQILSLPDAGTVQSAAASPFFGGLRMAWTNENIVRNETEPTWRAVTLRAWDLTGYCLQSNPHYMDSGPGVEGFLRKLFARSLAWYEDYSYLQGNGAGMPMGIIQSAATKVVTRQTSVQFTQQDVYKMSQALLPDSWHRAIWIVSVSIWEWLTKLGSTQWQMNMQYEREQGEVPAFVLNGQPGYVSEKLPVVGTTGDVVLCDPGLYVIGDRGAVEIVASRDEPTAFLKNQQVWRVTYRGDGQPWFSKTITLQDGATSVSPYVVLSSL